ncbi:MAG: YHS domain-containing protein [Acidobacteriaceae bacterium]|nr:YHS domain-containing protein [Acidobacteriaceae bacterium]
MFRALLEILFTIAVVLVARAVLTSIFKGIARASADSLRGQAQGAENRRGEASPESELGGELHKDPVCGTYVAESAALKRQAGGQTFYYCSESCREKHSLVAK